MSLFFNIYAYFSNKKWSKVDDDRKNKLPKVENVIVTKDLRYKDDKNKFHLFNKYTPSVASSDYPLIIDIHGGAWFYGTKDLNEPYTNYLASKGFNVLAPSYRLIGRYKLIDIVHDLFDFLHYVYENQEKIGVNTRDVMLVGDSAGGHLALLIQAINENKRLQKIYGVKPFKINFKLLVLEHPCPELKDLLKDGKNDFAHNTLLKAMFGRNYKNSIIYKNSSLSDVINDSYFPFIILVGGKKDQLLPQTISTHQILETYNIEHDYKLYNDVHVFEVIYYNNETSLEFNDYTLNKFKEIIGG